ncbi:MAG: UDP-N-acetylmuramoyl-tripeptide--D-alanyl-D-alanine ligase [Bacteroidales bacterium]
MTIQDLHQEFLHSSGICTDTRMECNDSIFVALKGGNFDGNRFVPDALDKGCRIAITERTDLQPGPRIWVVPSVLEALQQLAHFHRMKQGTRILAITGSNGKTTTKELTAKVLEKKFSVAYTRGNLNNHIGVPLTLLSLNGEEMAVVEMGANHPEEIAALCEIASPQEGMITNVGKAHLEGFSSLEGVLFAKAELYRHLAKHAGTALVDGSDSMLLARAGKIGVPLRTIGPEGDLAVGCRVTGQHPFLEVELLIQGKKVSVSTQLVGAFNLQNILLAAGAGLYYGVSPGEIAEAIAGYVPTNNRSQFMEGKRNRVIMDAYNANPSSMRGAVEGLLAVGKSPLMLILGQMAELGETSEEEHLELVRWVMTLPVERVLLVGDQFRDLMEDRAREKDKKIDLKGEPSGRITVFKDRKELEAHLEAEPPEGFHILVKGSRFNELERIIPLL